jgi:hypothetical protein
MSFNDLGDPTKLEAACDKEGCPAVVTLAINPNEPGQRQLTNISRQLNGRRWSMTLVNMSWVGRVFCPEHSKRTIALAEMEETVAHITYDWAQKVALNVIQAADPVGVQYGEGMSSDKELMRDLLMMVAVESERVGDFLDQAATAIRQADLDASREKFRLWVVKAAEVQLTRQVAASREDIARGEDFNVAQDQIDLCMAELRRRAAFREETAKLADEADEANPHFKHVHVTKAEMEADQPEFLAFLTDEMLHRPYAAIGMTKVSADVWLRQATADPWNTAGTWAHEHTPQECEQYSNCKRHVNLTGMPEPTPQADVTIERPGEPEHTPWDVYASDHPEHASVDAIEAAIQAGEKARESDEQPKRPSGQEWGPWGPEGRKGE